MLNSLIDNLLDRTVVGGYTNFGYEVRRRTWDPAALQPMIGKTVLVTGAAGGLGLAAAEGFARLGATVWLGVRSQARGEQAVARLSEQILGADLRIAVCDMSEMASIRRFVERFRSESDRLDVLVNNAGVMTELREESTDGVELTFATNVLGPFLLTNLLIPTLERSAPARIINVSSGGMYAQRLRVDDLESERGSFSGAAVYARTKRAEVVLTELWARRLAGSGVTVHAMHPGWAATPGVQSSLPRFYRLAKPLLRTPEQGADTIVWLGAAEEPALSSGCFWHDRRIRPTHLLPGTRETPAEAQRLWSACVELSGWHEDPPKRATRERINGAIPGHS